MLHIHVTSEHSPARPLAACLGGIHIIQLHLLSRLYNECFRELTGVPLTPGDCLYICRNDTNPLRSKSEVAELFDTVDSLSQAMRSTGGFLREPMAAWDGRPARA